MIPHELGHAITGWWCGFSAVPGLWKAMIPDRRGVLRAFGVHVGDPANARLVRRRQGGARRGPCLAPDSGTHAHCGRTHAPELHLHEPDAGCLLDSAVGNLTGKSSSPPRWPRGRSAERRARNRLGRDQARPVEVIRFRPAAAREFAADFRYYVKTIQGEAFASSRLSMLRLFRSRLRHYGSRLLQGPAAEQLDRWFSTKSRDSDRVREFVDGSRMVNLSAVPYLRTASRSAPTFEGPAKVASPGRGGIASGHEGCTRRHARRWCSWLPGRYRGCRRWRDLADGQGNHRDWPHLR